MGIQIFENIRWIWYRNIFAWNIQGWDQSTSCNYPKYANIFFFFVWNFCFTGKSLSEALLFAEHGENMLCTKIVLNVRNNFCTQHVLPRFELGIFMYWTCNSMNNLSSYCGLVDAKIRASDKDLPVLRFSLTGSLIFSIKIVKTTRQYKIISFR